MAATQLTLRVLLTSGEIITYEQNDPTQIHTVTESLGAPHRLYEPKHITIGESDAMTVLRTDRIARIDFITDELPPIPYLRGARVVREVDSLTFTMKYEQTYYKAKRKEADVNEGTEQIGFTRLDLIGVGRIYWEVVMPSQHLEALDVRSLTNALVTSDGLSAELLDGSGVMVVNPANIAAISFLPGPPVYPPHTWRVQRIGETLPG